MCVFGARGRHLHFGWCPDLLEFSEAVAGLLHAVLSHLWQLENSLERNLRPPWCEGTAPTSVEKKNSKIKGMVAEGEDPIAK